MRNRIGRLAAVAFALNLLASLAVAQSEPHYRELPNFHQVNEGLARGAQPREGGIQKLVALGIKTILNLRAADSRALAEESEARAAGLRYFNVPMEGLDKPKDEMVDRALGIINDRANQPVFVHCKHGADRTGTVIAIYRITHDGWSSEQALHEAKHYGLSWIQFGMKDFIKDYVRNHSKEPARPQPTPESMYRPNRILLVSALRRDERIPAFTRSGSLSRRSHIS
ncbi:MAG TPA: dual specificity protein phosphatase family protein [Pyrinomonadaceae bacterium]|jgi:protein tyrosine/serine phosphatase|nr:dual specificity protein phosphatase family protein [Pyrinomonadaceae bacterium]